MSKKEFLQYYNEEIEYLRTQGELFSQKHPKEAAALHISKNKSSDPHVERLIESFSFLSAQLRQRVDNNFFKIGESLLHVLHPHYMKIHPSFSIARFEPNKEYTVFVKKGTELTGPNKVRFRTIMDSYIYPMSISKITTQNDFLKLTLSYPKVVELSTLTVHLQPHNHHRSNTIFQSLLGGDLYYSFDTEDKKLLPGSDFKFFGYDRNETITPSTSDNFSYHLLQDFFLYPEKFLFFTLNLSQLPKPPQNTITLWIPFQKGMTPKISDFHLHAIPVVNLFEAMSDPITVDENKIEYPLTVNAQNPDDYEIHTITKVYNKDREVKAFYEREGSEDMYYSMSRKQSFNKEITGTDTSIRLHFEKKSTASPYKKMILYASVLSTNRNRINEITEQDTFQSILPIPQIQLMFRPKYLPFDESVDVWKLLSQLSINHLYFSDPKMSMSILKDTLRLNGADETILDNIKNIGFKPITTRLTRDGIHGYIRGVEITLEAQIEGSMVILSGVLHQFFATQVSLNHFVSLRLVDVNDKKEIKTWPPLIGKQKIL